jgi:hypothetical protein
MRALSVFPLVALLLAAAGCSGDDKDPAGDDTAGTDTGAPGDTGPPLEDQESVSSYEAGTYRTTSLVLLGDGAGIDLNGDGEPDNQLPAVLNSASIFVEGTSPEEINKTLATSIAEGDLVLLIDAWQDGALLTMDLLLGAQDEESGALSVDPASYGDDSAPVSRLTGTFSDEVTFAVESDSIEIPFSFFAGEPPLFIPVALARIDGQLATTASGELYGAVPLEDVMSQVLEPLIPTGDDYDPDTYLGYERDELLEFIETLATKTLVDVELDDGRVAFSAALSFEAEAASW